MDHLITLLFTVNGGFCIIKCISAQVCAKKERLKIVLLQKK